MSNINSIRRLAFCLPALCCLTLLSARADVYNFDERHSLIRFKWNHIGMSYQSARFLKSEGRLHFDPKKPTESRVTARIDVRSLHTGVVALDRQLSRESFFHTEKYPEITFESREVKVTGKRTGVVAGDLTIKGMTRPVKLDVRWNYTGPHPFRRESSWYDDWYVSGFSARTVLQRSQWGMKRWLDFVPDDIEVEIEIETVRISKQD